MSVEHVVDGMIKLLQKNVVARSPLISSTPIGSNVINIDNTLHFEDTNEVMITDDSGAIEYHTILKKLNTSQLLTLHPVERDWTTIANTIIQKAIGHVPLFENEILFGDREVISTENVTVTIEPENLSNEWIYLQGGLSEEYRLNIMIYLKADAHEESLRAVIKYADNIYRLLNRSIHMDMVNDKYGVSSDLTSGTTIIPLNSIGGLEVDELARYEVQDNNSVEIDFKIDEVIQVPPSVRLNRHLIYDYKISDKLFFQRRVKYLYDSRVDRVEYGNVSKDNSVFKAASLSWFGKETEEYVFPQHSLG